MEWMVLLSHLATGVPMLIVWAVAVVLAVARWEKHPNVSLLVVSAVSLFFFAMLVGVYSAYTLPQRIAEDRENLSVWMGIEAVVNTLLHVAGWSLLVGAIFGWRKAQVG